MEAKVLAVDLMETGWEEKEAKVLAVASGVMMLWTQTQGMVGLEVQAMGVVETMVAWEIASGAVTAVTLGMVALGVASGTAVMLGVVILGVALGIASGVVSAVALGAVALGVA